MYDDQMNSQPMAIDVVKAWYDQADASLLTSDFTCKAVGYGTRKSTYRGASGMLDEFFGEIGAIYESWALTVDRMLDAGQSVTVLGHYTAKRPAKEPATLPYVHVWDVSGSKIQSVTCFTDAG